MAKSLEEKVLVGGGCVAGGVMASMALPVFVAGAGYGGIAGGLVALVGAPALAAAGMGIAYAGAAAAEYIHGKKLKKEEKPQIKYAIPVLKHEEC